MSRDLSKTEKQKIIEKTIDGYLGNCPCPYSRDRAGRKCGKRSAYSRPGGYELICYVEDMKDKQGKRPN